MAIYVALLDQPMDYFIMMPATVAKGFSAKIMMKLQILTVFTNAPYLAENEEQLKIQEHLKKLLLYDWLCLNQKQKPSTHPGTYLIFFIQEISCVGNRLKISKDKSEKLKLC